MQECSVPLVAWPYTRQSHSNKIARKVEHARCCSKRGLPRRSDGSSFPWVPESTRIDCPCTDTAPVTALDTTTESRDSAIFRLTLTRVVNPYDVLRRTFTFRLAHHALKHVRIRTSFRNLHVHPGRNVVDVPTSRQMVASPRYASFRRFRHLAGRFEREHYYTSW